MTQTIGWGLASALLAMIVSVVSPAVGIHANGENVELNDLSELAEGETRTFGSGEDVITATREGDVIRIALPRGGDDDARVIDCKLEGPSQCYAFTSGESAGVKMVMVSADGPGQLEKTIDIIGIGSGEGKNVFRTADSHVIMLRNTGDGETEVKTLIGSPGHPMELLALDDGMRVLRCPEGDTTMNLDAEDALTYYCPKHNVELEEAKGHPIFKTIQIHTDTDGDSDTDEDVY
jgi:hypothetical protein